MHFSHVYHDSHYIHHFHSSQGSLFSIPSPHFLRMSSWDFPMMRFSHDSRGSRHYHIIRSYHGARFNFEDNTQIPCGNLKMSVFPEFYVAELSPNFWVNSSLSPNYPYQNHTLNLEMMPCRRFPPRIVALPPVSCWFYIKTLFKFGDICVICLNYSTQASQGGPS